MKIKFNIEVLLYLALLTLTFMLLEVSFFLQVNSAYWQDFSALSNHFTLPLSMVPDILIFIGIQIGLHAVFCLLVWFSAVFFCYLFRLPEHDKFTIAMTLWLTGMIAIVCTNQCWFPNSHYAQLSAVLLPYPAIATLLALSVGSIFLLCLVLAFTGFIVWLFQFSICMVAYLLIPLACWLYINSNTAEHLPAMFDQPNVFIIGIDSLRPDFLGYFGADVPTPVLDQLLNQSTVFTEAITPIARTFPAWASILTGELPQQNGVRTNLMKIEKVNLSKTLPSLLHQHGYQTIYATDESRFSHINAAFGFDKIIAPPADINDFLLGTFNDFPLSNLIVNTALGRSLFPHSYANRPVFATYDPSTFIQSLSTKLLQTQHQPLFMAIHFCLPHHPYLFAGMNGSALTPLQRYQASVMRVDQQVGELLSLLQQAHLLEKAVVVVLSDHGEALELHGDRVTQDDRFQGDKKHYARFYPPSLDDEAIDQSAGHGTDVLGLTQYHSLLAIKLFGMGEQHVGDVTGIAPLTNIKLSVLSLVGTQHSSEALLANAVRGQIERLPLQHVITESDFSPSAIRSVYPQIHAALLNGLMLYEIDPKTTQLAVRGDMLHKIIRSKQYADLYGEWMLALYPNGQHQYDTILINLQTGEWTNNLHSPFAAKAPAKQMLANIEHVINPRLSL